MAVYPLHAPTDTATNVQPQAADDLARYTVRPEEIQSGDWLRDLGTLRQVVSVEALPAMASTERIFIMRFAPLPGVEDLALGIPGSVMVTLWRAA